VGGGQPVDRSCQRRTRKGSGVRERGEAASVSAQAASFHPRNTHSLTSAVVEPVVQSRGGEVEGGQPVDRCCPVS